MSSSKKSSENVIEKLQGTDIYAWIKKYEIKTENGIPLDFHTFRFLLDIYWDDSPFICCMKAAQIGFTTCEIIKSIYEAKNENLDIIYVLPTGDDVKKFSGGKTNRIIKNNPILQEWTADKDSVEQKRVGQATIYYQGSWTERVALMISARNSSWMSMTAASRMSSSSMIPACSSSPIRERHFSRTPRCRISGFTSYIKNQTKRNGT